MDEREVIMMALFKLGETSKRLETLANVAHTPRGRRMLGAVSRALAAQEQRLRTTVAHAGLTMTPHGQPATVQTGAAMRIRSLGSPRASASKQDGPLPWSRQPAA